MSNRPASPVIEQSPAEKFFGLVTRPFSLTPDLRFAYHSRSHTQALEQVTAALRRREGIIVVTGAIGTGKTMLCRTLLETFESRTFLSLVLDPGLAVEDLLRQVLGDFGIIGQVDAPRNGPLSDATRHQFVTTLQRFLQSLIPLKAHAVIMIDEAQHLSPRVLEEIRLLSNFETDEAKLLQIVLVGQPDLDELLRRSDMQQLNQRVARRCELHPLSPSEVGDYIERRLTVATSPDGEGAAPLPGTMVVRFTPAAANTVAQLSGGIPRVINTLCDRSLDVAYERQVRTIEPDVVVEAAERLKLDVPGAVPEAAPSRRTGLLAAVALLAVAALVAWWIWPVREPGAGAPQPTQAIPAAPSTTGGVTPPPGAATPDTAPAAAPPQAAPPAGSAPATAPAAGSQPTAQPAASVPPVSGNVAPAAAPAPAAASGSFQIAIAAFRTERRAQEVAAEVMALPVPASVRMDTTGTWFRVIAGPFSTRAAADQALESLSSAGYAGVRVAQVP